MRIAILGGSFDPPHLGHLLIARQVLRLLALDQVWLMPNYSHAFNKKLSSPEKRYAMCQLMEEKGKIIASNFEIKQKGVSYSYKTLQQLKKTHPQHEFSWIIGSDQLSLFTKWRDWQKLLEKEKLIFVPRENKIREIKKQLLKLINKDSLPKNILFLAKIKPINISSTLIREGLKENLDQNDLIPRLIKNYICKNNLYLS
jgi:nicotinate-nucleotide adenylyltransferase